MFNKETSHTIGLSFPPFSVVLVANWQLSQRWIQCTLRTEFNVQPKYDGGGSTEQQVDQGQRTKLIADSVVFVLVEEFEELPTHCLYWAKIYDCHL